jgi:hypothetical protein
MLPQMPYEEVVSCWVPRMQRGHERNRELTPQGIRNASIVSITIQKKKKSRSRRTGTERRNGNAESGLGEMEKPVPGQVLL